MTFRYRINSEPNDGTFLPGTFSSLKDAKSGARVYLKQGFKTIIITKSILPQDRIIQRFRITKRRFNIV